MCTLSFNMDISFVLEHIEATFQQKHEPSTVNHVLDAFPRSSIRENPPIIRLRGHHTNIPALHKQHGQRAQAHHEREDFPKPSLA